MPSLINDTNLVLIPKNDNLVSMLDWIPLSLRIVIYKLVSKVLANKLNLVLNRCISLKKSAFVSIGVFLIIL